MLFGAVGERAAVEDFEDAGEVAVRLLLVGQWTWNLVAAIPPRLTFSKETLASTWREAMAAAIASWFAPASARAPTSMSPAIPENASR